jgi:hypothetical protein
VRYWTWALGPPRRLEAGGRRLTTFAARVNLVRRHKGRIDASRREAIYGPLDGSTRARDTGRLRRAGLLPEAPEGAGTSPQAPLGEARFFRGRRYRSSARLIDRRSLEVQQRVLPLSRPGETPEQFAQRCDSPAG